MSKRTRKTKEIIADGEQAASVHLAPEALQAVRQREGATADAVRLAAADTLAASAIEQAQAALANATPAEVERIIAEGEQVVRRRRKQARKQGRADRLREKRLQTEEPPIPAQVCAIPIASTFRDLFTAIGGIEIAMNFLMFSGDEQMRQAAIEWKEMDAGKRRLAMEADELYVEKLLLAHGVDPDEAFGRICVKARRYALQVSEVLHAASKPLQVQKSAAVSLQDGELAQRERMRHLESAGLFALPKASTVLNVSATANAQANTVQISGGLPGLEDISAESDDWLLGATPLEPQKALPEQRAVIVDVPQREEIHDGRIKPADT